MEHQLKKLPFLDVLSLHGIVTRQSCWLTKNGCTCKYAYGNMTQKKNPWQPSAFPSWLLQLTDVIEAKLELPKDYLNSCNANQYNVATHDLYWHNDNEKLFRKSETQRDVFIVSISFGATRTLFQKRNGECSVH